MVNATRTPVFFVLSLVWMSGCVTRPSYDSLSVHTPREVADLTTAWLRYKSEEGERWTPAQETWKWGYGDCEDWAIVTCELLWRQGKDCSVLMVYPDAAWSKRGRARRRPDGHATAVGQSKEGWWMVDVGDYANFDDIEAVVNHLSDRHHLGEVNYGLIERDRLDYWVAHDER